MEKDLTRPAVVYQVTNTVNGKFYIGMSSDFKRRKNYHVSVAKRKGHNPFYRALRKYGANAFQWEILVECSDAKRALQEEVRLIAALKPQYNASRGGQGYYHFSNCLLTEDGRRRISEAHKGKQRRLGSTHTPETRERLRQLGLQNRDKWLARSHLSPQASSRPVICLDDGRVYPSVRAAATAYHTSESAIAELCGRHKRRRTAAGRVFRYVGDERPDEDPTAIRRAPWRGGKNPYKGVHRHVCDGKDTGRWRARIATGGRGPTNRKHSLGIFDTPEAARDAYERAQKAIADGTFRP